MFSRVKSILLVALVLLASGQISHAASYGYSSNSPSYPTVQEACLAAAPQRMSSTGGVYTDVRYVSSFLVENTNPSAAVLYRCNLQYYSKNKRAWIDEVQKIFERETVCSKGAVADIKGPISSAIYSEKDKRYYVASPSSPSGCFEGCTFDSEGSKSNGCFLVSGSKTQGYCNYKIVATGKSCSANTLIKGDHNGDSINSEPDTETPVDPGTGGPVDPGTGPTDPGTGGPVDPGTGPTDPGTGGPVDPGTGPTDPGTGGPVGPGTGPTDPGTGGPVNPGTGGPVVVDPSVPCKGVNFGEPGCAEYTGAQLLNSSAERVTEGVEQAQNVVAEALGDVQSDASKVFVDSESSVMQRFNAFLPKPSACVNPVVSFFSWLSIPIEICRYTFVKALLTWLFSVATFIYVFRVMTSLGSTSEV